MTGPWRDDFGGFDMRSDMYVLVSVLLGTVTGDGRGVGRPPTDAEVRVAVERCLPYMEREGVAWIEGRGCMSCHHFAFTIWTHHEARGRGIAVDGAKLDDW